MSLKPEHIKRILDKEKFLSLATTGGEHPDNGIVCFAYDDELRLYFGSYSDTLKCRNIARNPHVAICVRTLQIHGITRIVDYGTEEYKVKRAVYDSRFPQYTSVFEKADNELYEIRPLVIWNYDPAQGEMHRDELILDAQYYQSIEPYRFPGYAERS